MYPLQKFRGNDFTSTTEDYWPIISHFLGNVYLTTSKRDITVDWKDSPQSIACISDVSRRKTLSRLHTAQWRASGRETISIELSVTHIYVYERPKDAALSHTSGCEVGDRTVTDSMKTMGQTRWSSSKIFPLRNAYQCTFDSIYSSELVMSCTPGYEYCIERSLNVNRIYPFQDKTSIKGPSRIAWWRRCWHPYRAEMSVQHQNALRIRPALKVCWLTWFKQCLLKRPIPSSLAFLDLKRLKVVGELALFSQPELDASRCAEYIYLIFFIFSKLEIFKFHHRNISKYFYVSTDNIYIFLSSHWFLSSFLMDYIKFGLFQWINKLFIVLWLQGS